MTPQGILPAALPKEWSTFFLQGPKPTVPDHTVTCFTLIGGYLIDDIPVSIFSTIMSVQLARDLSRDRAGFPHALSLTSWASPYQLLRRSGNVLAVERPGGWIDTPGAAMFLTSSPLR